MPDQTDARKQSVLPGIFLFVIGLALVFLSVARFHLDSRYAKSGREVIGRVTGGGSSSHSSYIRYEFAMPDGRRFIGQQSGYSGHRGETVLLQYLADDPSWNRVAGSDQQDSRVFLPLGVVGVLALIGGIWSVAFVMRSARSR